MSELEAEFQQTLDKVLPQIKEQLQIAREALNKAIDLADEHGVPFQSTVSNSFYDTYVPYTFNSKYWEAEPEVIQKLEKILGFSPNLPEDGEYGWASEAWTRSMDCFG